MVHARPAGGDSLGEADGEDEAPEVLVVLANGQTARIAAPGANPDNLKDDGECGCSGGEAPTTPSRCYTKETTASIPPPAMDVDRHVSTLPALGDPFSVGPGALFAGAGSGAEISSFFFRNQLLPSAAGRLRARFERDIPRGAQTPCTSSSGDDTDRFVGFLEVSQFTSEADMSSLPTTESSPTSACAGTTANPTEDLAMDCNALRTVDSCHEGNMPTRDYQLGFNGHRPVQATYSVPKSGSRAKQIQDPSKVVVVSREQQTDYSALSILEQARQSLLLLRRDSQGVDYKCDGTSPSPLERATPLKGRDFADLEYLDEPLDADGFSKVGRDI